MGKSYRRDSGNDRWRKKAQQRHDKKNKKNRFNLPLPQQDEGTTNESYSPFSDTPEHHEKIA